MKLLVYNVPHHISTYGVKEMFRSHGEVTIVFRKGDAIEITMPNRAEAKKAMQTIHHLTLLGNVLRVTPAETETKHFRKDKSKKRR